MQKLHKRKSSGFTIIETLIVLAIVGVIMIVVFLAVPALNRNSHNSQYRTEANNLMSAYQEMSSNAGGSALTASADGVGDALAVKNSANTKTIKNVSIIAATTAAQTPAIETGVFVLGSKCTSVNSNVPATSTTTTRSVAFIYQIESASGKAVYQCIDNQ